MYLEGKGVEKDFEKGATWMRVAADNGNELAKDIVRRATSDHIL